MYTIYADNMISKNGVFVGQRGQRRNEKNQVVERWVSPISAGGQVDFNSRVLIPEGVKPDTQAFQDFLKNNGF